MKELRLRIIAIVIEYSTSCLSTEGRHAPRSSVSLDHNSCERVERSPVMQVISYNIQRISEVEDGQM